MFAFCVWVDADSFPVEARQFVLQCAGSHSVPVAFVANHTVPSRGGLKNFKMIVCPKESGSADNYIFDSVSPNDIVLTRDIPFAARLLQKKIVVMNDRGVIFTPDMIEERLREREFSLNLSHIGIGFSRGRYYGEKELGKFSACFEDEIRKHIMIETYNIKRY